MKNIKKFLLVLSTVFCIIIPAFFLTACGGNGNNANELLNLSIVIDGNENFYSQTGWINADYGVTLNDIARRVSYYFEFKDGTKKNSEDFDIENNAKDKELYEYINSLGEFNEKYYLGSISENGGETTWTETDKIPFNQILDAGYYKIVYQIAGRELELQITVNQSEEDLTNLSIAVAQNDSTNYNPYSTYKYGCPTYKNAQYDAYTSNYKVWVKDLKTNKVVSGTNVKSVYALPTTAPEDKTIESYWDGISDIVVNAGDNLIDKYNEIDSEDTFAKKQMQQIFLSDYASGNEITLTQYNNGQPLMYDDNTMVVNTESLKPGDYYLIAVYADKNQTNGFTTPKKSNFLRVEKGDFIWKNTISKNFEDYNETEVENFISSLSMKIDYYFNTYTENPIFTTGNGKALSMDFLKTLDVMIESSYPEALNDQGEMVVWQNYMHSNPVCEGGRGAFGWYDLVLTGKDMNGNSINGLDCSNMDENGSIKLQAKLKFSSGTNLGEYYNEDNTIFPVTVSLHQGIVNKPILYTDNFEYNGTSQSPSVTLDENYVKFYNITGTRTATEVGNNYKIRYTLKDIVNYVIDDCNENYVEFNWCINKITFDDYELINSSRCMYNGAVVSEDDGNGGVYYPKEITYNPNANNNKTIIVMIDNEKFNLLKTKDENVSINFSIYNNNGVIGATISQEQNDQFTLTFSDCSSDTWNHVDIKLSINGTAYSNAYNPENVIQICINKLAYTSEELATIYGCGSMFTANGSVNYSLANSIQISQVTRVVPLTAVPSTVDQTITNAMGQWEIYYEYENNETLVVPGSTQLPNNCYRLKYHFVPNDDMYVEIVDIDADIDWYKEDIPDAVLTALQTELTTHFNNQTPSITFEIRSDCIAISQDALPTHDLNNTDFQGIDGTWELVYQYEDNNGVTEEHLAGGNNSLIYYDWFKDCRWYSSDNYTTNANYLISSDRNWQIVFEPENNNAYNRYYISSEIVITNN